MNTIDSFRGKYFFLSNFFPVEIVYEGINYQSSEHAYQAAKTKDRVTRLRIAQLPTPQEAKKIGQTIKLRSDWEDIKAKTMYDILLLKFEKPELAKMLVDTGDAQIIENNWWGDIYWGVCNGVGQNALGKLLMKIREKIKGIV